MAYVHPLEGLKIRRKAAGITATEMAKRLGVSYVTYMKYESGDLPMTWSRVLAVCSQIGIDNPRRLTEYELSWDEHSAIQAHAYAVANPPIVDTPEQIEWDRQARSWRNGGADEEKVLKALGSRPDSQLEASNTASEAGTVVAPADSKTVEIAKLVEGWT